MCHVIDTRFWHFLLCTKPSVLLMLRYQKRERERERERERKVADSHSIFCLISSVGAKSMGVLEWQLGIVGSAPWHSSRVHTSILDGKKYTINV